MLCLTSSNFWVKENPDLVHLRLNGSFTQCLARGSLRTLDEGLRFTLWTVDLQILSNQS